MGACYSAEIRVRFKDEKKAIEVIKDYISKDERTDYGLSERKEQGIGTNSFDDLMKIFFADHKSSHVKKNIDTCFTTYSHDFDASYGWEGVIVGMFQTIAPYLEDNSRLYLNPDNEELVLLVKNGQCMEEE